MNEIFDDGLIRPVQPQTIAQIPDTVIELKLYAAFAQARLTIETADGPVTIVLDIESVINLVSFAMDDKRPLTTLQRFKQWWAS